MGTRDRLWVDPRLWPAAAAGSAVADGVEAGERAGPRAETEGWEEAPLGLSEPHRHRPIAPGGWSHPSSPRRWKRPWTADESTPWEDFPSEGGLKWDGRQ